MIRNIKGKVLWAEVLRVDIPIIVIVRQVPECVYADKAIVEKNLFIVIKVSYHVWVELKAMVYHSQPVCLKILCIGELSGSHTTLQKLTGVCWIMCFILIIKQISGDIHCDNEFHPLMNQLQDFYNFKTSVGNLAASNANIVTLIHGEVTERQFKMAQQKNNLRVSTF
jgi:hypothetical protein